MPEQTKKCCGGGECKGHSTKPPVLSLLVWEDDKGGPNHVELQENGVKVDLMTVQELLIRIDSSLISPEVTITRSVLGPNAMKDFEPFMTHADGKPL